MATHCIQCNYITPYVANYNKHLKTERHRLNTLEAKVSPFDEKSKSKVSPFDEKSIHEFACKYCGQLYKHKQSVTKHIKYSCTKNKDEDLKELVRLMNCQLEQQKKEIEQLNNCLNEL